MTRLPRPSPRVRAASLAAAVLLAACGGGGDGTPSDPVPAPAPGAITIESSTPAQGATGVDRSVQPQLTLSAAVDPATVVLTNRAGTVNAAATAQGKEVTVTPVLRLLPATQYTVQVGTGPKLTFTTRDGAWSATATRLSAGTADVEQPDIAVDARGNAIAVWHQQDGVMRNIWAARYERGTGWSAPFTIEQNAALADGPRVAMDAEGNAIAVWIQQYVGAPSLWASRFTPAGGWEAPELVELMDGSAAVLPRIAMNAAGHAVVAWYQQEAVANIYVNRYVPGSGWQGVQSIETYPLPGYQPYVAVTPDGTAVVAWRQRNAANLSDLAASSAAPGGTWSTPVLLESAVGNVETVDLAAAADGSVVAAWAQADGQFQCWSSVFRPGTGWSAGERLDSGALPCLFPRVATDGVGGVHFTWEQDAGGTVSIWTRSALRGTWSAAESLTTGTEALFPVIAADAVGNALLVWMQDLGNGNYPAYASRRVAGGTWSTPRRLEPGTDTSVSFPPAIAMDASGSGIAFWPQWDPVTLRVDGMASHFD